MASDVFEIHVSRDGRWVIDATESKEKEAVAAAKRIIGQSGVEGVKVIKEGDNQFGKVSRSTIFEQSRSLQVDDRIQLGKIETAPRCQSREDLYGGESRLTISRLFKNYMTKAGVTPTEVMHNAREMKRVMDSGTLVSSAVSRVATVQTGEDRGAARGRRDELFNLVEQVAARARTVESAKLPSIAAVGLAAVEGAIAEVTPDPQEKEFLTRVAISRDLIGERSFFGKLDSATKWADGAGEGVSVSALDDFIADTLTDAGLVQDLLGRREDLCDALMALIDLSEGRLTDAKSDNPALAEVQATGQRLGSLISQARLPGAVRSITERVRGQIAGAALLSKSGKPEDEEAALRRLAMRLVPADAPVRGGAEMAVALVERGSRLLNRGGASGRGDAVDYLTKQLTEPARILRFLLAVYDSSLRLPVGERTLAILRAWLGEADAITLLFPEAKTPDQLMRSTTALFHIIKGADLPADLKNLLTIHLDNLLYAYIQNANLLARIDDPDRPLLNRARMLMSMCLPEMLPPGRAVETARQRIIGYLRRPNFEVEVVADITDPTAKANALRDFFDLMRRAGFR